MLKITILTAYFGPLPNYFDIWLKSCARNPSVNFIVVSDQFIDVQRLPINVSNVYISFKALQQLISEKLKMEVMLDSPYKLCDFKPAYGLIFSEYLSDCDFWGHCDIDLVWGDLELFFKKFKLKNYDRFLDRGHLSLYRNTKEMNCLFMGGRESSDYRKVFSTPQSCYFDESGMYEISVNSGIKFFRECLYADMDLFHSDFRHAKHPSRPRNYKHQAFLWNKGKIFQVFVDHTSVECKEWCYLHFQKREMSNLCESVMESDSFYITNNGFYICEDAVNFLSIEKMNPKGSFIDNMKRKEFVVCGNVGLSGIEFIKFLTDYLKIIVCSSSAWERFFKRIWIKTKG